MFKNAITAAVALGLTLGAAAPAFAKDVLVRYSDLDLSSAAGQQELAHRVDAAAREACDYNVFTTGSLLRDRTAVACYHKARQQGAEQIAALTSRTTQVAARN